MLLKSLTAGLVALGIAAGSLGIATVPAEAAWHPHHRVQVCHTVWHHGHKHQVCTWVWRNW